MNGWKNWDTWESYNLLTSVNESIYQRSVECARYENLIGLKSLINEAYAEILGIEDGMGRAGGVDFSKVDFKELCLNIVIS